MTEEQWLTSDDPAAMLQWLRNYEGRLAAGLDPDAPSARKLRLFACACCRQVWDKLADDAECPGCLKGVKLGPANDPRLRQLLPPYGSGTKCLGCAGTGRVNRSRRAVEVAERFADGEATIAERDTAWNESLLPERTAASVMASHAVSAQAYNFGQPQATAANIPPALQAALLRCVVGNPFCIVSGLHRVMRQMGMIPWLNRDAAALARAIYEGRDFSAMPILADALQDGGCESPELLSHLRGPGPHARGCFALDLVLGQN